MSTKFTNDPKEVRQRLLLQAQSILENRFRASFELARLTKKPCKEKPPTAEQVIKEAIKLCDFVNSDN